jgi:hypothetical protein
VALMEHRSEGQADLDGDVADVVIALHRGHGREGFL